MYTLQAFLNRIGQWISTSFVISSVAATLAGLIGWMIKVAYRAAQEGRRSPRGQIGDLRGEIGDLRGEISGEKDPEISDLRAEVYKELSEINARLGRIEGHLFGADFPAVAP